MILTGKAVIAAEEFEKFIESFQAINPETPLKRELTEKEQEYLFLITSMFEIDKNFSKIMTATFLIYKQAILKHKVKELADGLVKLTDEIEYE